MPRMQIIVGCLILCLLVPIVASGTHASQVKRGTDQSSGRLQANPSTKPTAIEPILQIRLSGKHTFAPGYVRSVIRVQPHSDNRLLRVTLDSPDFYRSSDFELDGAEAAINHFVTWTSLPAGQYEIVATLFGPHETRAQITEALEVLGQQRDDDRKGMLFLLPSDRQGCEGSVERLVWDQFRRQESLEQQPFHRCVQHANQDVRRHRQLAFISDAS